MMWMYDVDGYKNITPELSTPRALLHPLLIPYYFILTAHNLALNASHS